MQVTTRPAADCNRAGGCSTLRATTTRRGRAIALYTPTRSGLQVANTCREREHHAPVSLACWCDLAVRPDEDGRVGAVAGKGVVSGSGLSNSHRQENAI